MSSLIATIFFISVILCATKPKCYSIKVRYMKTDHPMVTFVNHEYIEYFNLTVKRYVRGDPFYYMGANFKTFYEFHNNVTVNFYFYEYLSNSYRRSFVELHFRLCDLIEKDLLAGFPFKQGRLSKPCPYAAGVYELSNITVPLRSIPKAIPFVKGRLYSNLTATGTKERLLCAHFDMELKNAHVNKTNWVDNIKI